MFEKLSAIVLVGFCIFLPPSFLGWVAYPFFVRIFHLHSCDPVDIHGDPLAVFLRVSKYSMVSGVCFILLFRIVEPHISLPPMRWELVALFIVQFLSGIAARRGKFALLNE